MASFTAEVQENLRVGKQVVDALRDCTPGEGRHAGVTVEELDQLALTFCGLADRQRQLLSAGLAVHDGPFKTAQQVVARAAGTSAAFAVYQRYGVRGVAVFVAGVGAAITAGRVAAVKL